MKRLLIILALTCPAKLGFSQTDYRPGYVISNDGDTTRGFVNYREGSKPFETCSFKPSMDEGSLTYQPTDISGYGFENGKFFLSRQISIKGESGKVAFLELIISGRISLYKFDSNYYVEKEDQGLQQLINELKEVTVDGAIFKKHSNRYIGTLKIYVLDCEQMTVRVEETKLSERSLSDLVKAYNQCKGVPSKTFKAKGRLTKAVVGLTGGITFSQINFDASTGYRHLAGNFEVSRTPVIGGFVNVSSRELGERISFQGGVSYFKSTYHNNNVYEIGLLTERNYVTIELQQLKIPIGICYTFPKRNFTPYITLGVSTTFNLNSSSSWVQEAELNNVVETYYMTAITFKKNQFGGWGSIGVLKSITNRLDAFAEVRFEHTDGVSESSSAITNLQILVGIRTK